MSETPSPPPNPEPIVQPQTDGASAKSPIAGFGLRTLAFCIDGLLLAFLGGVLGFVFIDFFVGLGEWGRLIGFAIALAYFGLLNSRIGRGRTLGKRIAGIRVVDRNGSLISPGKSALRYTLLSLPFLFNGLVLPAELAVGPILAATTIIVFGGFFGLFYLHVFNKQTRQLWHDLACGTFVVREKAANIPIGLKVWKGHFIAMGAIAAVFTALAFSLGHFLKSKGINLDEAMALYKELNKAEFIKAAGVYDKVTTHVSNKQPASTIRHLDITAFANRPMDDYDSYAIDVVALAFSTDSPILDRDLIRVSVGHRFNILIAHGNVQRTFQKTPEQWRAILQQRSSKKEALEI